MRKLRNIIKEAFKDSLLYKKRFFLSVIGILISCLLLNVTYIMVNYLAAKDNAEYLDFPENTGIYYGSDNTKLNGNFNYEVIYYQEAQISNNLLPYKTTNVRIYGVSKDFLSYPVLNPSNVRSLQATKLLYGEELTEEEYLIGMPYIYIEEGYAKLLFAENPIGKKVEINSQDFYIKGILEDTNFTKKELSKDIDSEALININVYLPDTVFQYYYGGGKSLHYVFTYDATKDLGSIFNKYEYFSYDDMLQNVETSKGDVLDNMRIIFAVVIIAMGVLEVIIVIFNLKERTGEIGIKRALGATKDDICFEFVLEIVFVGFIAIWIGIFISLIINFLMEVLFYKDTYIMYSFLPIDNILLCTGFVLGVISVSAITPMYYIASLNIVDVVKGD